MREKGDAMIDRGREQQSSGLGNGEERESKKGKATRQHLNLALSWMFPLPIMFQTQPKQIYSFFQLCGRILKISRESASNKNVRVNQREVQQCTYTCR
jgi:hypothetical protein